MTDLLSDPLFVAMNDPSQSWGDLFVEREDDSAASTVVLLSRKDIWTHFPVVVVPLGTASDGAERHAIVWRQSERQAWRDAHPSDYFGWKTHERAVERRLLRALRQSPTWTVEPADTQDQICTLRMCFPEQIARRPRVSDESIQPAPCLRSLNDIKAHFPVVWRRCHNSNMYSLELYDAQIRKVAHHLGLDVDTLTERISARLSKALYASPAWRVLLPENEREFARIEFF